MRRAQEVTALRFPILTILLIFVGILSAAAASESPVAVRYREGLIHGFLVLSTLDGVPIAAGDLTQVARGDQVTTQLAFRFKDGSRQEETTVFSQRRNFRLISYHLLQKGPSFKNESDLSVTCATGKVTVRYTDDNGKEKVANEHLALPPDLGNGLIPTLLMNIQDGTPQIEVPMVVAAPKPRLVKVVVNAGGTEPFSLGGFSREAVHYVAKVDLGGIAGVVAPIVGKQPPDSQNLGSWRQSPGRLKVRDTVLHGRANLANGTGLAGLATGIRRKLKKGTLHRTVGGRDASFFQD